MKYIIPFSMILFTIMGCASTGNFYNCKEECKTEKNKEGVEEKVCKNVCTKTGMVILSGTQTREAGLKRKYKDGQLIEEDQYIKKDSSPLKMPDFGNFKLEE